MNPSTRVNRAEYLVIATSYLIDLFLSESTDSITCFLEDRKPCSDVDIVKRMVSAD